MAVWAVVFDVGGVLERVDDGTWPVRWVGRWARRMNLPAGHVMQQLAEPGPGDDVVTGRVSEERIRRTYVEVLGLRECQAGEMMAEMWDFYCGRLDTGMRDFAASLRPTYTTAILSNSADGARREEQRRYGFEQLVDVLVYSHEVGPAKPDPAVYRLTEEWLGVAPPEILFVDDHAGHAEAARELGWRAVLHRGTHATIREVTDLLRRG